MNTSDDAQELENNPAGEVSSAEADSEENRNGAAAESEGDDAPKARLEKKLQGLGADATSSQSEDGEEARQAQQQADSNEVAAALGQMDEFLKVGTDERSEVSAATIGRLLGLATASEIRLMEGKIDLVATRVNNLTLRMEKVLGTLTQMPTGGDLERIDVQLGSLKGLIREALGEMFKGSAEVAKGDEGTLAKAKIVTNQKSATSSGEA